MDEVASEDDIQQVKLKINQAHQTHLFKKAVSVINKKIIDSLDNGEAHLYFFIDEFEKLPNYLTYLVEYLTKEGYGYDGVFTLQDAGRKAHVFYKKQNSNKN